MIRERKDLFVQFEQDDRFIIIYGKGVDDTYISEKYTEVTIEQVLWEQLHQKGYDRVVFYSPHRAIFYLDDRSAALCSSYPNNDSTGVNEGSWIKSDGPLGSTSVLPVNSHSTDNHHAFGDVHAIRFLDTILREQSPHKSAVVFVQAETIFRYFEDQRTIAGLIGDWSRLPAINQNLCILLFSVENYQNLVELAKEIPVPELRYFIHRHYVRTPNICNLVKIEGPGIKEIERLIIYLIKTYKLKVSKANYQRFCQWMVAENQQASQWIKRGRLIDKLNLKTAILRGWFSGHKVSTITALEKLDTLTGLVPIKKRIHELAAYAHQIQTYPHDHNIDDAPTFHMIFTGNPGTGKTTVARILGELFHELNILPRGHIIEVHASDLVADHVGGTTIKTNKVIDQALDGILFIDEAYALTETDRGGFGQEAIETLLTRMEDERNRFVVIAAGYPDKMTRFISSNPGLRRRFPLDNHIHFPDYSPDELIIILKQILGRRKIPLDPAIEPVLTDLVKSMVDQRDKNFGNAGEVRNLADSLSRRWAERIQNSEHPENSPLIIDDIPEEYRSFLPQPLPDIDQVLAELNSLVGLDEVKTSIYRLIQKIQLARMRQEQLGHSPNPFSTQHLVFSGNPGTGKTTIARIMGQLYKSLGILRLGHVIEVSRSDLVAGYVGQTALKTQEKIIAAVDGVLFNDEAYSLTEFGLNQKVSVH